MLQFKLSAIFILAAAAIVPVVAAPTPPPHRDPHQPPPSHQHQPPQQQQHQQSQPSQPHSGNPANDPPGRWHFHLDDSSRRLPLFYVHPSSGDSQQLPSPSPPTHHIDLPPSQSTQPPVQPPNVLNTPTRHEGSHNSHWTAVRNSVHHSDSSHATQNPVPSKFWQTVLPQHNADGSHAVQQHHTSNSPPESRHNVGGTGSQHHDGSLLGKRRMEGSSSEGSAKRQRVMPEPPIVNDREKSSTIDGGWRSGRTYIRKPHGVPSQKAAKPKLTKHERSQAARDGATLRALNSRRDRDGLPALQSLQELPMREESSSSGQQP